MVYERRISDLTVVELPGLINAYCGRLLSLLGARVIKVEPPGGDPSRKYDLAERAQSNQWGPTFWYNNANKECVVLDLEQPQGREDLLDLLDESDVLISAYAPDELGRLGLDPHELLAARYSLVVTAITPFGLTGPYRNYKGSDLVGLASGGQLYLTGYPDRRPVKYGGYQAYKQAGLHAAYGTLLALFARTRDGHGQVVDVSMQECVANALQTTMQMYDLNNDVRRRVGSRLLRCEDGFVRCMAPARGWTAMLDWLDEENFPHNLREIEVSQLDRPIPSSATDVDGTLEGFFLTKTKKTILREALERGIALTPVNSASDVLEMDELKELSYWESVHDESSDLDLTVPGPPFRISAIPLRHAGPPRATSELALSNENQSRVLQLAPEHNDSSPPLHGITVLDFTWFGAGSMATRVFAHFGAEVIKVESATRVDGIRLAPPFRGESGLNKSGFFNNFNSGKRSVSLNMHSPEAKAIVAQLLEQADIVADNFSPGVLARFGFSDEEIHRVNPSIVIMHMPMGGSTGLLSKAVGFGATIEAVAGLVHMTGDVDRQPVGTEVNFPDYSSNPYHAATAVLAGLVERASTGNGCVVELSQTESTIAFAGEAIIETQMSGKAPERRGNISGEAFFNDVLPCSGDDEWCAITCFDEVEFAVLLNSIGLSERSTAAIDEKMVVRIAGWTKTQTKYELAALLQNRGIAAYPVTTSRDLVDFDPQLASREHYVLLNHPEAGWIRNDRPAVVLSRTPGGVTRPAPCLGEHTLQVLHEVLGMDDSEVQQLVSAGAAI